MERGDATHLSPRCTTQTGVQILTVFLLTVPVSNR